MSISLLVAIMHFLHFRHRLAKLGVVRWLISAPLSLLTLKNARKKMASLLTCNPCHKLFIGFMTVSMAFVVFYAHMSDNTYPYDALLLFFLFTVP